MKKIVIILCFIILIIPSTIEAKTLNDMYNELAKLKTEYNANKNNKNLTEAQINKIGSEINTINSKITTIRQEIKQAEKDIETNKQQINDKKKETDGLIQFLQISNGGNIYLEYLFDAENYTDFIYRYEVVKQLTNYNSDLIDELENLILDLQKKEVELEDKNKVLEKERSQLTSKLNILHTSLESYKVEGTDLEQDIKDLQKQIKAYEDRGCTRYQDLSTCNPTINATGWTYPLKSGCVTSEYTGSNHRNDWIGGGSHYGIDLSCVPEGTYIYPAADGVIARVVYKSSCGGNMVWINHMVNGKPYTTVYMHMLSIRSEIKPNTVVTTNTILGGVGGGSTWSQNGGYDYCTGGTHLHFGTAEGHNAFNFNSYAFNPREIFAFPKLIYSGGGYFKR